MRRRGRLHRIHIITPTSSQHLPMKTATFSKLPHQQPHSSHGPNGKHPLSQPPMNRRVASQLTANMLPYSARKKYDQRMPLYSVWNPATSSLSASARSNGARLQLAVPQMKNTKNATNVNGLWNRFQFQNQPVCSLPIMLRFRVPATQTGTTTHIERGTS